MHNNARFDVNIKENMELYVKCVINFDTPITEFVFSLSNLLTVNYIQSKSSIEWEISREYEPQWSHRSNEFRVFSETPFSEIEIAYYGEISGWCNVIENRRIALSTYSAWYVFETSIPIDCIFYMKDMEDYHIINARYDNIEKAWIYGETNHNTGNIIALKKGKYFVEASNGIEYFYLNEAENKYAKAFIFHYKDIIAYYSTLFGNADIKKLNIVSIDREGENVGGAYFRNELVVIDKMIISNDDDVINQNAIRFLGHELGHYWFFGADTSTWEDWLNETGAEWALLSFANSVGKGEIFEKQLSYAEENYKDTPIIKSEDLKRPNTGVHTRGVALFHSIYLKYGIEKINDILKILANLENTTTEEFLLNLREKIGNEIPEIIEMGLKIEDYSKL